MKVERNFFRVFALTLLVGAIPFLLCASVHAQENRWLDDYSKPVGLTYDVRATLNANYVWRGIPVGAFNIQPNAAVGYGGLYVDMWWNIGTQDWTFKRFQPEVDLQLGFARWGLNASVMFIHNFNCGFFDFTNHPDGGNGLEARLRYTVSSKLPISFLWATRIGASDGYVYDGSFTPLIGHDAAIGDTIRAYSTYLELSYTQALPYGLSLYGALGITPWRSFYSGYQREFSVQNIEVRLSKDWTLSEHCGLKAFGMLSINPSALAADKTTAQWHPNDMSRQSINANVGVEVYLR